MTATSVFVVFATLGLVVFVSARRRAIRGSALESSDSKQQPKVSVAASSPFYHGVASALCAAAALAAMLLVLSVADWGRTFLASSAGTYFVYVLGGAIGIAFAALPYRSAWRARLLVERFGYLLLFSMSLMAVLTTVAIVLSLIFETFRFFELVSLSEFFGLEWSPGTAIRSDQVGSEGSFGITPLIVGTALITLIAMAIAVPIGISTAIYTAEFASNRSRAWIKPILELLAGIPTVVYGFFAALILGPFIYRSGGLLGLDIALESALAAGVMMGIMIVPYVSSMSDDAIAAVPESMRNAAYGLGATKYETVVQVVLPAAAPGIVGGLLLAVSRAIGETMIVVMAAGLAANLTINPLQAVTTFTVQIVTSLVGDQEFDSARTLSAFALGSFLFIVTFLLNIAAFQIIQRYRRLYRLGV